MCGQGIEPELFEQIVLERLSTRTRYALCHAKADVRLENQTRIIHSFVLVSIALKDQLLLCGLRYPRKCTYRTSKSRQKKFDDDD